MISVEDQTRLKECKNCDSCLKWHKYCHSECCKMVELNIDPSRLQVSGSYVRVKVKPLSPSDQWYYRLRGVPYNRGVLSFRKDRITMIGRKIIYFYVCDYLDENNKCKGHPDRKPEVCKVLTEDTANDVRFFLTDNCLFRYKMLLKGGEEHGKESNTEGQESS